MKVVKITKIKACLFLIILFSSCVNNSESRIKKVVNDSYLHRNQISSNRLVGKHFMFYEITGCEFKGELKSVMIYRELDCSTCVKNCYSKLQSRAAYENIAIIKLGIINKKDTSLFANYFEEIYCDEREVILNTYDCFPTPVVFSIENQTIKKCYFCY